MLLATITIHILVQAHLPSGIVAWFKMNRRPKNGHYLRHQNPILVASQFPNKKKSFTYATQGLGFLCVCGGGGGCHVINDMAMRQVASPASTTSPLLNVGHLWHKRCHFCFCMRFVDVAIGAGELRVKVLHRTHQVLSISCRYCNFISNSSTVKDVLFVILLL